MKARATVVVARILLASAAGLCACVGAIALSGCPTLTTAAGFTPATGIVIRSSTLVGGHGCGKGLDQVFRYSAVVFYADDHGNRSGAPIASGVFDCFADGLFENLRTNDGGSTSFVVSIYAYNQFSLPADLDCPPDVTPCPAEDLDGDTPLVLRDGPQAPWTTTCHATQQQDITVVAVCDPLAAGQAADAGVTRIAIDTRSFPMSLDGGCVAPGTPAPLHMRHRVWCGTDYVQANAFYRWGPAAFQVGQTTAKDCPDPLVISPAKADTPYDINLYLLSRNGSQTAYARCAATPEAGATTAAACNPVACGPASP